MYENIFYLGIPDLNFPVQGTALCTAGTPLLVL